MGKELIKRMLAKEVQDLSSVDLELDDEISFENEDELNRLEYEGNGEKPLFESVKVTKKDFSIFELHRKYKKRQ